MAQSDAGGSVATAVSRRQLGASKRWVVKIGSALLTADGKGLDRDAVRGWVTQMAALRASGVELVLVSSGSVAEGMTRLGWTQRPTALHDLQAAAALGQMGLVQTWESAFQAFDLHTAQVLVTHDDLSNRGRYLNARSTLRTLLGLGIIPVVNENDTVVTDEIRFGDNDTLAGLVANLVQADLLLILTDQQGLFDADPRTRADARLIDEALAGDETLMRFAGGGGSLGRGGMRTKLSAATLAARSGAATIIASGAAVDVIDRVAAGESVGTLLKPAEAPIAARKQWLAGHLKTCGRLVLDAGAVRVLRESGSSLLAVGVTTVAGDFERGDLVSCVSTGGDEVARGLVNYAAVEARQLCGQPSDRIQELLGYVNEPELIHRDNLVIL